VFLLKNRQGGESEADAYCKISARKQVLPVKMHLLKMVRAG